MTARPQESRAWTIPVSATAPLVACVIHTDFQHAFFDAAAASWDELVKSSPRADGRAAQK